MHGSWSHQAHTFLYQKYSPYAFQAYVSAFQIACTYKKKKKKKKKTAEEEVILRPLHCHITEKQFLLISLSQASRHHTATCQTLQVVSWQSSTWQKNTHQENGIVARASVSQTNDTLSNVQVSHSSRFRSLKDCKAWIKAVVDPMIN